MRTTLTILLALTAGCWPRIPGQWDDYATPDFEQETTQLTGHLFWRTYTGGYWSDPAPQGGVWLGWLARPAVGFELSRVYTDPGYGCNEVDRTDWDAFLAADLADLSADAPVALEGPDGTVELEAVDRLLLGQLTEADIEADSGMDLVDQVLAGSRLTVEDMFTMPAMPTFDGPSFDGDSPATVGWDELSFSWEPLAGTDVWLSITTVNDDLAAVESFECRVPGAQGTFRINPDLIRNNAAAGGYVTRGIIAHADRVIPGAAGVSRTFSIIDETGFLWLE